MAKLVYDFTEGNKDLKDLLGGKGANLAEMTNLGLPVPPGFIITTEACREYLREMRLTVMKTRALDDDDVDAMPAEVRDRLMQAFRDRDG